MSLLSRMRAIAADRAHRVGEQLACPRCGEDHRSRLAIDGTEVVCVTCRNRYVPAGHNVEKLTSFAERPD